MMVSRFDALNLFDDMNWKIKGFLALRDNMEDELLRLDSVLRQNTVGYTTRQTVEINEFDRITRQLTVDGKVANPTFYYKKRLHENWKVGRATPSIRTYPQEGPRLAYSHLWVECRGGINGGGCCLATLIGAARHGVACLHPRVPCETFLVSSAGNDDMEGMYTLSGTIRTSNIKCDTPDHIIRERVFLFMDQLLTVNDLMT
jgi:hypothetical protein